MHKVTMSAHQPHLPTFSATKELLIATSMDEQLEHRPRQQIISEERPQLIETATGTLLAHQLPLLITLVTLQQPIVTDMATRQERIDQAPITLVIPTLAIQIPTETPEVHLPLQRTTSATQRPLIATGTVIPKDPPLPQRTTLAIAVLNSAATTPTLLSGLGNDVHILCNEPRKQHNTCFRGSFIIHKSAMPFYILRICDQFCTFLCCHSLSRRSSQ